MGIHKNRFCKESIHFRSSVYAKNEGTKENTKKVLNS